MRRITKKDAMSEFESGIVPMIVRRHGYERVAMRTAWNDYVDSLIRRNRLTPAQADLWVNPYDLKRDTLERSIRARVAARRSRVRRGYR